MIDPTGLLTILTAFFVVAAFPGPATLGCAAVAMAQGRVSGLAFGIGLGLGLAAWGLLAALGLGAVLAATDWALGALKLAGGLYLVWLAIGAGRDAMRPAPAQPAGRGRGNWVWRGLWLNLSNPKAVFAWAATLAIGLDADAGTGAVALATTGCIALGFMVYALWALGFSLPVVMRGYRRVRVWVQGTVALVFAAAGLGLIRSALSRGAA